MSSDASHKVSHATPGTGDELSPFQVVSEGIKEQYETITCQEEYRAFSLEEHRLADYSQGRVGPPADVDRQLPGTFSMGFWNRSPTTVRKKLDLLRGNAIEIHVGTAASSNESTETSVCNKWSLPKNLISHYSPFLQAVCSWNFRETQEERIELSEDDPTVFGLFVEWMYYGNYDISPPTRHPNIDAKCWILGDKLLCGEFQNYALSRLYERHITDPFCSGVSCDDVKYVWDNTASVAKLRQFYTSFVVQYFANRSRLIGTAEDWDSLLQNHSDMRILLLENWRKDPSLRMCVRDAKEYFELDMPHLNPIPKFNTRDAELSIREKKEESGDLKFGGKEGNEECDSAFGSKDALCAETKSGPATAGASVPEVAQEPAPDFGSEPAKD